MEGAKRRGSARSAKGSTAAGNLRRHCFYFLWQFELRTPDIDFAKWNATASLTNEFQVLAMFRRPARAARRPQTWRAMVKDCLSARQEQKARANSNPLPAAKPRLADIAN